MEEEEWDGRGCCGEPYLSLSLSLIRAFDPLRSVPLPPTPGGRRFFSFARSPPRSLYSTLRISLRLEPRRTSHPAPREPIPTHVEAPTRDAGDDLRSRPNVPECRRHPCAQPPSLARCPLNPLSRAHSLSRPLSRDHVQRP